MTRTVFVLCFVLGTSQLAAQVPSPISVSGDGTTDFLSADPTEFSNFGGTGTINFRGVDLEFTLTSADVGGLMITDPGPPIVADFNNSVPVTFTSTDPNEDSEISTNYAGVATLTPVDAENFTASFVATFEPIVSSGTGVFSGVVGGSFEMTAVITDPFVPKFDASQTDGFSMDIPYEWESTGGASDVLLVVPEPGSIFCLAAACLAISVSRLRFGCC